MIPSVYPRFCLCLHYYWGFPGGSAGNESTCNAGEPGLILGSGKSPGEGIGSPLQYSWASLVAQMVKNPPAMQETWVRSLGWEEPLEERAWQLTPVFLPGDSPWTEEPVGLQSMGLQRVRHSWASKHKHKLLLDFPFQLLPSVKVEEEIFSKKRIFPLDFTFCTYKFSYVCKGRQTVTKRDLKPWT